MGHSNMDKVTAVEWQHSTVLILVTVHHTLNGPQQRKGQPYPDTFPNTGYHLINPGPHSHPNLVLQLLVSVRRWGITFTKLLLARLCTSVFLKAG